MHAGLNACTTFPLSFLICWPRHNDIASRYARKNRGGLYYASSLAVYHKPMLILANSHELILGDWFDLGSWHQRQESMHFQNPIRAIGCSIRCVAGHERIGLAIKVACHISNKRGPQSSPLTYYSSPTPAFSGGRGM